MLSWMLGRPSRSSNPAKDASPQASSHEDTEKQHDALPRWGRLGILNDKETDEVPGSVLLMSKVAERNEPLGLQHVHARTSSSSIPLSYPPEISRNQSQTSVSTRRSWRESRPNKTKTTPDGKIILEPQPEDTPNDPLNWPTIRRDLALITLGLYCMIGGGMTTILAAGFNDVAATYHTTRARVSLTTGLYMMGLGIGSVIMSPTAILFGKRPVYLLGSVLFAISAVWCALSPDFSSLVVARIFQGIAVSPVECLPSATIAEIFFLHERAYRLGIYTLLLLGGKNLVPLVSAAIIEAKGWRWAFWVVAIIVGAYSVLLFLFVPETFWNRTPRPRKHLRKSTSAAFGRNEHSAARPAYLVHPTSSYRSGTPQNIAKVVTSASNHSARHVDFVRDSIDNVNENPTTQNNVPLSTSGSLDIIRGSPEDRIVHTEVAAQELPTSQSRNHHGASPESPKETERIGLFQNGHHVDGSPTGSEEQDAKDVLISGSKSRDEARRDTVLDSAAVGNSRPESVKLEGGSLEYNSAIKDPIARPQHQAGDEHYLPSLVVASASSDMAKDTPQSPMDWTTYHRQAPQKSYVQTLKPWNGRLSNDKWLKAAIRPFVLFAYPSILWSAMVYALSVGWLIVLSESVSVVYQNRDTYHFTALQTGLVYLSPFIGGILGTAVAGKVSDFIVRALANCNDGIYEPEFRLVMVLPILLSTVAGLMGFGWSVAERDAWIVPTVFFGVISFGCTLGSTTAITFAVDCYRDYAGEALVTLNFSKNILHGLIFSLFFTNWLEADGPKKVFLAIGGIQLGCLLLSIPMYIYGKRARMWTVRMKLMERI